jgi:hypothetical protein
VSELRQRHGVVQRRRNQTPAQRRLEAEARENFKLQVIQLDHGRCIGSTVFTSHHRCSGPLEAHHCIRQQQLRLHISTMPWTEEDVIAFIWTPLIGATVCHGLHEPHTNRSERIPFEWLPARVVDYCAALDPPLTHLLEREHPRIHEA